MIAVELSPAVLTALIAAIGSGGVVFAYIAWKKLPSENQQILVTAAQGAVMVQTGVIETLTEENKRLISRVGTLEAENLTLRIRVDDLASATKVLEAQVKTLNVQNGNGT